MFAYKKSLSILSVLLICIFMITACAPAAEAPAAEEPAAEEPAAAPVEEEAPAEEKAEEPAEAEAEKVVVSWWHIQTVDEQKALWQAIADEYMAANPNVTVEITVLENENFKTKLTTVMQSNNPPDIFQSWGGGVLNDYAKAGLLKDITADLEGGWGDTFGQGALGVFSYDGKNYGVPRDMGLVGFWYNTDHFAQAGIEAPPATWAEFLEDVDKLKAAGITPVALAGQDKWPGAFWWEYLAVRIGGKEAFDAAYNRTGAFTDETFVEAGNKLKELVDMEPFQNGFLGAVQNDQAALVANGEAAMELMGQWAPGVQAGNAADGVGLGDKLGFFPFPEVEGGKGNPTDALGGGNGFVVGMNAEPEAIDFLKFLSSVDSQTRQAEIGLSVPVVKGGEAGLEDPLLKLVQESAANAPYFQLYYDQFMPAAVGGVINDAVQGLFAGTMTPEEVAQMIEDSAAAEMK